MVRWEEKERDFSQIRFGKNTDTGEIEIHVSTGEIVNSGTEKRIKGLFDLAHYPIRKLVRLAPIKEKLVQGVRVPKTLEEIAHSRRSIEQETKRIIELKKAGVPHLPRSYIISYISKDGREKKRCKKYRT